MLALTVGGSRIADFELIIDCAIDYYGNLGILNMEPIQKLSEAERVTTSMKCCNLIQTTDQLLKYPSGLCLDKINKRLFISDSGNNRILITNYEGQVLEAIGSGKAELKDGDFTTCSFSFPIGRRLLYLLKFN